MTALELGKLSMVRVQIISSDLVSHRFWPSQILEKIREQSAVGCSGALPSVGLRLKYIRICHCCDDDDSSIYASIFIIVFESIFFRGYPTFSSGLCTNEMGSGELSFKMGYKMGSRRVRMGCINLSSDAYTAAEVAFSTVSALSGDLFSTQLV